MRMRPLFTIVSFAFHACLLVTPLFVMGHAVLLEQSWGVSWWSLPPLVADVMTLVVVAGGVFFLLRRIAAPQVRYVSHLSDFLLVLLVISPFLTGFIAHQQWLPARGATSLHIASGVLWLIAIPFTRLAHMFWFVFTPRLYGQRVWRGPQTLATGELGRLKRESSMPDTTDMKIADRGIDEGIKKLTPERIEKTIRHVLDNESAARMKVYLDTCVHCGPVRRSLPYRTCPAIGIPTTPPWPR